MKTGRISSNGIQTSLRLNGGFHLNESTIFENKIMSREWDFLKNLTKEIFTAGRSKRIYVKNPKKGIPFLGNTDVNSVNPKDSCTYASKYFWRDNKAYLQTGMILTGRVGQNTVGRFSLVREDYANTIGSDNIIRIVPQSSDICNYLYAFLSSKYGYSLTRKHITGAAQPFITEEMIGSVPVPILPNQNILIINGLIEEAAQLRVEANRLLEEAERELIQEAKLHTLTPDDYEYFGSHVTGRPVAAFTVKSSNPFQTTLAAFNHSVKIEKLKEEVKQNNQTLTLKECLAGGSIFSTGSFKRLETTSLKGVRLINQSDIFNFKIEGKLIAPKFVKNQDLVSYGEVIIAGVGTLGENETFCRVLFAGEELVQELISGEFIRMKAEKVPAGYLYAWLATQYGFRMIRACQAGTKLCRPIPKMLLQIPVPILEEGIIKSIDQKVVEAHKKRFEALQKETAAIGQVEEWIEAW